MRENGINNSVWGVYKVRWNLKCVTPLVFRDGHVFKIVSSDRDEGSQISDLSIQYVFENGELKLYYQIPASSIRGALRSFCIQNLIDPTYYSLFSELLKDMKEDDCVLQAMKKGLNTPDSGIDYLVDLFGIAVNSSNVDNSIGQAGRLILETEKMDIKNVIKKQYDESGMEIEEMIDQLPEGSEIKIRNPLDRISLASKFGGLHQFLELSPENEIIVEFYISNPTTRDFGLFKLWAREIEYGMIRFGALASVGKGRMTLDHEQYSLWLAPNINIEEILGESSSIAEPEQDSISNTEEIFAGLWNCFELKKERLPDYV